MKMILFCLLFAEIAIASATHTLIERSAVDKYSVCTATAIAPRALLTAKHCRKPVSLGVTVDGREVQVESVIADRNDHAIYILKGITFRDFVPFAPAGSVRIGQAVQYVTPDGAIRRGKIVGTERIANRTGILMDIRGGHGNSGSAITDESGKIVMVLSYSADDQGTIGAFPFAFTAKDYAAVQAAAK